MKPCRCYLKPTSPLLRHLYSVNGERRYAAASAAAAAAARCRAAMTLLFIIITTSSLLTLFSSHFIYIFSMIIDYFH
jgi:hypothetical protein